MYSSPTLAYGPMQPNRPSDPPDMPWYELEPVVLIPTTITTEGDTTVPEQDPRDAKLEKIEVVIKRMEDQAEFCDEVGNGKSNILWFYAKRLRKALE